MIRSDRSGINRRARSDAVARLAFAVGLDVLAISVAD
jgi:hypothetical protein